jgi:hypothetical protein
MSLSLNYKNITCYKYVTNLLLDKRGEYSFTPFRKPDFIHQRYKINILKLMLELLSVLIVSIIEF